MTTQEVLIAAKSGNPQAIAALMNRHLQPKGITAKTKMVDDCLHVMLESTTVPNQSAIVPYITNGIKALEIATVKRLVLYARVIGEDLPAWSDRVEWSKLELDPTPDARNSEPSATGRTTASNLGTTAFVLWTAAKSLWSKK